MAVAGFRVGGGLSHTFTHCSVLQPTVGGGKGAARLLRRGAPLYLGTLPLTHLHPGGEETEGSVLASNKVNSGCKQGDQCCIFNCSMSVLTISV